MATAPTQVVCFSAYSQNLRARAVLQFLGDHGFAAQQPRSYGPAGSVWELGLTLIPYCLKALTCRADLVVGVRHGGCNSAWTDRDGTRSLPPDTFI